MHVLRKELCIRMVVLILVVGGLLYYGAGAVTKAVQKSSRLRAQPAPVNNVALPTDREKEMIAMGIALLRDPGRRGQISYLAPSLVEKKQGRVERAQLSMLVLGEKQSYAMINDRMYRKGDILSDGRKVVSMDAAGVVLATLGSTEMLVWIPPLKVKLDKSAPVSPAAAGRGNATTSVENPVSGSNKKIVMDADKALQLIKQLEAVSGTKQ